MQTHTGSCGEADNVSQIMSYFVTFITTRFLLTRLLTTSYDNHDRYDGPHWVVLNSLLFTQLLHNKYTFVLYIYCIAYLLLKLN